MRKSVAGDLDVRGWSGGGKIGIPNLYYGSAAMLVGIGVVGYFKLPKAEKAGLLCTPQLLFPFAVKADRLELRSDRPFEAAAGARVLQLAEEKLARSPLFSRQASFGVYICSARWRQVFRAARGMRT